MRLPNLLIIGAMKAGTTSLHDYLSKHPDIFMSDPKEIHYNTPSSKLSEKDYLSSFQTNKKIAGTTPQSYTKVHHVDYKETAEALYRTNPNVKLIYIVRDPFERILSHALENKYGDSKKRARQNLISGHYWKTSLYYYQISEYLKFFKKSQIHVLTLENLKNKKLEELNKIFRFLDLQELSDETVFDYVMNKATSKGIPVFIKSQIWYRILNKFSRTLANKIADKITQLFYRDTLQKPSLNTLIDEKIISEIKKDSLSLAKEFQLNISNWNLSPSLED